MLRYHARVRNGCNRGSGNKNGLFVRDEVLRRSTQSKQTNATAPTTCSHNVQDSKGRLASRTHLKTLGNPWVLGLLLRMPSRVAFLVTSSGFLSIILPRASGPRSLVLEPNRAPQPLAGAGTCCPRAYACHRPAICLARCQGVEASAAAHCRAGFEFSACFAHAR